MFSPEHIQSVPHCPGVYLMLDKKSTVLYVGKAKDLSKRLSSYCRQQGSDHSKTSVMLAQVHKVDTIITRTEKDALILESSLIKKHAPKYNIILRDDKNYPFIKVTVQEQWPRVMMARRRQRDGARYFGPYSSSSAMWATLRLISKLFPLRRCRGNILKPRPRPCLNHQMGQCLAPCAQRADSTQYADNVAKVIMILEGHRSDVITELKKQMHAFSAVLDFEKAARIRDQILALSQTLEKQVIVASHLRDQDIFGYVRQDTSIAIAILIVRSGIISGSRSYFLSDPFGDDESILSQVLNQFYFLGETLPQEIIIPFPPLDADLLQERFTELRQSKVALTVPQRGDKMQLIEMATANALQLIAEKETRERSWTELSASSRSKLLLQRPPERIECLDISNTSGKMAVGSLVHFARGAPAKESYRHYRIRTIDSPDDYKMMAEVLQRRFRKGIEEKNLPDLFVVDGGKGHLAMACKVAKECGITEEMELLGIAKEKNDEGEKIYKPGRKNPLRLAAHDPVLLLLMRIRDETHRFGITLHRKLRNKSTLSSQLDTIAGIGPARRKLLLQTLGSLKRIAAASIDDLTAVPGINKDLALRIQEHFQGKT